jgi:hypothetical protein
MWRFVLAFFFLNYLNDNITYLDLVKTLFN